MGVGSSTGVCEVNFNMAKGEGEEIEVWICLNRSKQLKFDKFIPAPLNRDPQVTLRHMEAIRQNWKDIIKGTASFQRYREISTANGMTGISPISFFYDTCYKRLFELYPETRSMFGDNIVRQGKMLVNVVTKLCSINVLSENARLVPTLEKLAERHVQYGVKPEHYGAMGQALLHAMEVATGIDKWTERLRHYWLDVFSLVSNILIAATVKRIEDLAKNEKKGLVRRMMGGKKQAPSSPHGREMDDGIDPNALQTQLTSDLVRREGDARSAHSSQQGNERRRERSTEEEDRRRGTSTEDEEVSVKSEGSDEENFSNISDLDSHFSKIQLLEQQLLQLKKQIGDAPAAPGGVGGPAASPPLPPSGG